MLFFGRGKALKSIEEGLKWSAGGTVEFRHAAAPEGVFVEVPALAGREEAGQYLLALGAEARYALGEARSAWVHLRGEGVSGMAIDRVRAIVQAACPEVRGIGLDLCPDMLGPGDIAGYRSISVDRFNFRVNSQFSLVEEPVRRARALGAFTSVEVCLCEALSGRAFLGAVEKAAAASPAQVALCDERASGAFGWELMEKAGELLSAAGYRRVSAWVWAQGAQSLDILGSILTGRAACLGPGAGACFPAVSVNPPLSRWLETRLNGQFEATCALGRVEGWLGMAAGLYELELKRENLDCKMHRHVAGLMRLGVVDKRGRPQHPWAMEFCHRAARAAREVVLGATGGQWKQDGTDRRSVGVWKTGSRG